MQKESANDNLDILSNGFKLRSNSSANNASENYIYAAWAEAPQLTCMVDSPTQDNINK